MSPIVIISLAVFIGVSLALWALATMWQDSRTVDPAERLRTILGQNPGDGDGFRLLKNTLLDQGAGGLISRLQEYGLNTQSIESINRIVEQSGCTVTAGKFLKLTSLGTVFFVALGVILKTPLYLSPLWALTGASLPSAWILWRRKVRIARFYRQLPDALEVIARALRSGHSLASGMKVVVQEMLPPLSQEFALASESMNLGMSPEQALREMTNRMPNRELQFFATAVAMQRQYGGDLAEILDKIVVIVRERFLILGQVQALTGEGRISGLVLMALPVALFLALYHLNPGYVMVLFTEEIGQKMLTVAIVLQLLGALVIRKIVNIKI